MAGNQNLVAKIIINAQDNASKAFQSIQDNAGKLAAALVTTFSVSIFKSAIDKAADFELALDKVASKGEYTAEEMEKLKTAAFDIGAKFGVSGIQAAEGLEILAAAGLKSSEAIAALPNVMKLAKAENLSMEESATLISNTVSTMGLSFDETSRIAGVFVKAANLSTVSAKDLGESFKYSASLAHGTKYSLGELAGTLDVLAKNGIRGSEAGTALRSIMVDLDDPASKASKELDKLGISSRKISTVMTELKSRGDNAKDAIRAFGKETISAVKVLATEGGAPIKDFTGQLEKSGDAAGKTAATMGENFDGARKRIAANFENLQIQLGTPILKPLADSFDGLSQQFKTLLADGTLDKIGKSLADVFKAGGEWAVEFVKKTDFTAIGENIKNFAINVSATFDEIGSKAKTAGDVVNLVTGVFSAGFNTIQAAAGVLEAAIVGSFGSIKSAIGGLKISVGEFVKTLPGFESVGDKYIKSGEALKLAGENIKSAASTLYDNAGKDLYEAGVAADKVQTAFKNLGDSASDSVPKLDKIWGVSTTINEALTGVKTATDNAAQANHNLAKSAEPVNTTIDTASKAWSRYIDEMGHVHYIHGEAPKGFDAISLSASNVKDNIDKSLYMWFRYRDELGQVNYQQLDMSKGLDRTKSLFKDSIDATDKATQSNNSFSKSSSDAAASTDSTSKKVSEHTAAIYKYLDAAGGTHYTNIKTKENMDAIAASTNSAKSSTENLSKSITAIPDKESKITADTTQANQKIEELKTPTGSHHTVSSDASKPAQEKENLKTPTESLHTVAANAQKPKDELKKLASKESDTISVHTFGSNAVAVNNDIYRITQDTISLHTFGSNPVAVNNDIDRIKQDTISLHTFGANPDAPYEAIRKITQDTYSNHTIYVTTIQQNSTGGEIQHFQSGGMPKFVRREGKLSGFGGGDTVPAMLEPGEFIMRKEAVQKYGAGFMAQLNSAKMDSTLPTIKIPRGDDGVLLPIQKFQTGGYVNWYQAPVGSTDQLKGALDSAKATEQRLQRELDFTVNDLNDMLSKGLSNPAYTITQTQKINDQKAALQTAKDTTSQAQKAYDDAVKQQEAQQKAAEEQRKAQEKATADLYKQKEESFKLAGDDVGLENLRYEKEQQDLAGNKDALAQAEKNHQAKLAQIEADKQDKLKKEQDKIAEEKQRADEKAQQKAEKRQSQTDSLKDEVDGLNGNKIAIENRRYQKQLKELEGNPEAQVLARKAHAKKIESLRMEKQTELGETSSLKNNISTSATNPSNEITQTSATQISRASDTVTIKFESQGKQVAGSFARADVASVIDILKEAASRGSMPTNF